MVNRSLHHNSIIFTLAVPVNMSEAVVEEKSSGIRNVKSGNHGGFEITGLNNYYICKFQKGTEPGVGGVSIAAGMPHTSQMLHGNIS